MEELKTQNDPKKNTGSLENIVDNLEKTLSMRNKEGTTKWMTPSFEEEYPDLTKLLLKKAKTKKSYENAMGSTVSAIYLNLNTIEESLKDVENNKPSVDIQYHIKLVKDCLNGIKTSKLYTDFTYKDFVEKEEDRLLNLSNRADKILGGKERIDSIYK